MQIENKSYLALGGELRQELRELFQIPPINTAFFNSFELPTPVVRSSPFVYGLDDLPLQTLLNVSEIETMASSVFSRQFRLGSDRGFFPTGDFFLSSVFWEKVDFTWQELETDPGVIGNIDFYNRIVYASADKISQLKTGSSQANFDLTYLLAMVIWYQESFEGLYITVSRWELGLHEIRVLKQQATGIASYQISRLVHAMHLSVRNVNIALNTLKSDSKSAQAFGVPFAEFRNRRRYIEALDWRMSVAVQGI